MHSPRLFINQLIPKVMPKKDKTLRIKGNVHIAFNALLKENETSFFYDGNDTDIAMVLAAVADCNERFARILDMANHITITYEK